MTIALPGALQEIIQQNLLTRAIADALFPAQKFRMLIPERKKWPARIGEVKIDTRRGLLAVSTRARTPGVDPTPQASAAKEQWLVQARPYNDTIDTNLPTSHVSIVNLFLEDTIPLVMQAGQTLDHLVRNKLYNAYTQGNTYVTANSSSSTTLRVAYLNGFREKAVNGRPSAVGVSNALAITVNAVANTVVGVTPDSALDPDGPGALTLGTAITATAAQAVLSVNRSRLIRSGGATTSLGVASSNLMTLAMLRNGVKYLRQRNVPTMDDGTYHLHMDPDTEAQLFADTEFANLTTMQVNDPMIRDFAIGRIMGVTLLRNNETPNLLTTNANDMIWADVTTPSGSNAGVNIARPVLVGGGTMVEEALNVGAYLDDANVDPIGRSSEMVPIGNGGYGAVFDGIEYLVRPPLDRLGETVSQTWKFAGDWACPSDSLTYTPELFKRAVVFEHAAT